MRNILTLLLVCCCFSPIYAQKGKVIKGALSGGSALTNAVTRQVAKQTISVPQVRLAQITNMPGKPMVKLGVAVDNSAAVLPARMLTGEESIRLIWPNYDKKEGALDAIYLPSVLNTQEEVVYRGLILHSLQSVENILTKGFETNKVTIDPGKIFFAGWLSRALIFATDDNVETGLPVLVKFIVSADKENIYEQRWFFGLRRDYYLKEDVPASSLQDVLVFLEVNGKPDWYKATLKNGELIFTPAPSRIFADDELIEHKLDIPKENRDW